MAPWQFPSIPPPWVTSQQTGSRWEPVNDFSWHTAFRWLHRKVLPLKYLALDGFLAPLWVAWASCKVWRCPENSFFRHFQGGFLENPIGVITQLIFSTIWWTILCPLQPNLDLSPGRAWPLAWVLHLTSRSGSCSLYLPFLYYLTAFLHSYEAIYLNSNLINNFFKILNNSQICVILAQGPC